MTSKAVRRLYYWKATEEPGDLAGKIACGVMHNALPVKSSVIGFG